MRSAVTILFFFLLRQSATAQSKMSFEQYSFMGTGQNTLVAPVAHFETSSKWYAEARYNYEDINTVSLYAGHNFSSDKKFSWSFTPMAGIIAGNMKGGSFGLNTDLNYRKFYFSSQAQYSISTETRYDNFFYNWSELYYQPFEWMYTGVAVQHTRIYATNALVDPGLMLGFSYSQWSFPFYTFNPLGNQRYYVVGINWEWNHASRSHKKASPPIVNTMVK